MKRSSAQANDALRVTIITDICTPDCPAHRAHTGDVAVTALRAGDTVRVAGVVRQITEVTTDWAGKTGTFVLCGRRRRLVAALLLLDDGATTFIDETVEKICPSCTRTVTRFR